MPRIGNLQNCKIYKITFGFITNSAIAFILVLNKTSCVGSFTIFFVLIHLLSVVYIIFIPCIIFKLY